MKQIISISNACININGSNVIAKMHDSGIIAIMTLIENEADAINFSLPCTSENLDLVRGWQAVPQNIGNIITITNVEDEYKYIMINGAITSNLDEFFPPDGAMEVEFHGKISI